MSLTIYPYGNVVLTVPATESIAITNYGGGRASIYYKVITTNFPPAWQFQQSFVNDAVTLGPFSVAQEMRIEAGSSKVFYDVGSSPDTGIGDADTLGGNPPSYYATDSLVVHLAGNEDITGIKRVYAASPEFKIKSTSASGVSKISIYSQAGGDTYPMLELHYDDSTDRASLKFPNQGMRFIENNGGVETEFLQITAGGSFQAHQDIYVGLNTGGDSTILFRDTGSATWRSLKWVNAVNDWRIEDDSGTDRTLWNSGHNASLGAGSTITGTFNTSDGKTITHTNGILTGTATNNLFLAGFKNQIINGQFDNWLFGTSQTSAATASDNNWLNYHTGSTKTHSRQAFTIGQTDVPNNPDYFSRTVATTASGVGDIVLKAQRIEDVTRFSGETITLSFYAKADASKNIATEFTQSFGTGGAPSADVQSLGVTTHALTTGWSKFTATVTMPSVSGKTLGTNNNDGIEVVFWFDAGSNHDARTNSLGNQSGTFDLANVQIEFGSNATAFDFRTHDVERRLTMRYAQKSYSETTDPATVTTSGSLFYQMPANSTDIGPSVKFPVPMRATPTLTFYSTSDGATGNVRNTTSAANVAVTAADATDGGFGYVVAGGAQTAGDIILIQYVANAGLL